MEGGLVKCQPLYSRTFSLLSSIVIPLLAPVPTEFWGRGEEGGEGSKGERRGREGKKRGWKERG